MTPQQFLNSIKQRGPEAAYLFIGPEPYQRQFCRNALIQAVLKDPEERDNGVTRFDLEEQPLEAVVEDACSLSLFTSRRVIVVSGAEGALPRGKSAAEDEEEAGGKASAAPLVRYLSDPVPGVVLVFEAVRFDFEGDDRKKIERVRKFYAAIQAQVEFPRMGAPQARTFAQNLARRAGLNIGSAELDLLVEALGSEAARIAAEIEKLGLYAGTERRIEAADIAELVPEAREATMFALVNALARNDRVAALEVLDRLVRQSEYLPLALSFLATQFRLSLVAKEAGAKTAGQVLGHFGRLGIPMWPSRAEQVSNTVAAFSREQLATALKLIYGADKSLRDARPDDRVVMEDFILRLTA
jgi:DNA polymerase-3 subunit delta